MKKFKKIMAVLVAAVLMIATMVPAFAAAATTGHIPETKGTITIKNAEPGVTYNAYKILTLASFADTTKGADAHELDAYSYVIKADSKWLPFFQGTEFGATCITVDTANTVKINNADYYIATPVPGFTNPRSDTASDSLDEDTIDEYWSSSKVQQFAQEALKFATRTSPATNVTADVANAALASDVTVPTDLSLGTTLELGYYLVDSSLGTLCSLDTTNNEVEILEKNDVPDSDKEVKEDGTETNATKLTDAVTAYNKVNDQTIGRKVYFRGLVDIEKGAVNYVYSDKMSTGLTLNESDIVVWFVPTGDAMIATTNWVNLTEDNAEIEIGGTKYLSGTTTSANFYDFKKTGLKDSSATFEIWFNNTFLNWMSDKILAESTTYKFVVAYNATINNNAVIGGEGNPNTSKIFYGDTYQLTSTPQETRTFTWDAEFYKFTNAFGTPKALEGAVFSLSDTETNTAGTSMDQTVSDYYQVVKMTSTDPEWSSEYATANADSEQYKIVASGGTKTITTNSSGKFRIAGLDEGVYYLHEVTAPDGYNKLAHPIRVTITSTPDQAAHTSTRTVTYATRDNNKEGSDKWTEVTTSSNLVEIVNTTNTELPSTGGMGTTVLYIVGGMLVVLAGAYLFFSRKRTA